MHIKQLFNFYDINGERWFLDYLNEFQKENRHPIINNQNIGYRI